MRIDESEGFTLVRTFDATAAEIWEAWTDADAAAKWWHPSGTSTPREAVEVDARVGGHYTYTMVNDASGERVVTGGVYRAVVPFTRLAFTWGDSNGDPDDTPVITVTLDAVGDRTRMTFDLRGVEGTKGDGSFYDGWHEVLVSLGGYVERQTIDAELARPGARELLTSTRLAHLAYIGPDDTPRVIPVGFFWTGEQIVISTAPTSPKVTALLAHPDVALTIDAGETPDQARALSIRGRASVEIVGGLTEEYVAGARRSLDAEAAAEFEKNSARCTTRWRASRLRHTGCATGTSALEDCRNSSRNWPTGTSRESRIDAGSHVVSTSLLEFRRSDQVDRSAYVRGRIPGRPPVEQDNGFHGRRVNFRRAGRRPRGAGRGVRRDVREKGDAGRGQGLRLPQGRHAGISAGSRHPSARRRARLTQGRTVRSVREEAPVQGLGCTAFVPKRALDSVRNRCARHREKLTKHCQLDLACRDSQSDLTVADMVKATGFKIPRLRGRRERQGSVGTPDRARSVSSRRKSPS